MCIQSQIHTCMHVCVYIFHAQKILGILTPQTAVLEKEYIPEE